MRRTLRVPELPEKTEYIHTELAVAERKWKEWVIARFRVGEVPVPDKSGMRAVVPSGRVGAYSGVSVDVMRRGRRVDR